MMCCEDMNIAQKSQVIERTVSCPAGAVTPLCMHNHRRQCLIITNVSAGALSVSTLNTVANTIGIRIQSTADTLDINFRDHLHLVKEGWFGFPSAALTVNVIEVLDDDACGPN